MTVSRIRDADVIIFKVGAEQASFSLDRRLFNEHLHGSAHDNSRTEEWLTDIRWTFRLDHTTPRTFSRFCQFIYHGDYSPPPPTIRKVMGNHMRSSITLPEQTAERVSSSAEPRRPPGLASSSLAPSGAHISYERYHEIHRSHTYVEEKLERDGPEYQERMIRAKEERLRVIKEEGYPGYDQVYFLGIGRSDLCRELEAVLPFDSPLSVASEHFAPFCSDQAEVQAGKPSAIQTAFEDMRSHREISKKPSVARGNVGPYGQSDYLAPVLVLHVELYGLARYAGLTSLAELCLDKIHTTLLAIDFSAELRQDLFEVIMYVHASRGTHARERYLGVIETDQDPLNTLLARYLAWKAVDADWAEDESFLRLLAEYPRYMREFWRQILAWRIER